MKDNIVRLKMRTRSEIISYFVKRILKLEKIIYEMYPLAYGGVWTKEEISEIIRENFKEE